MEIVVTVKHVYGVEHIYPSCEMSKILATIAGHKTLTTKTISLIKQLGYRIRVENGSYYL